MMSFSKIVKSQSNVVFQDVIAINTKSEHVLSKHDSGKAIEHLMYSDETISNVNAVQEKVNSDLQEQLRIFKEQIQAQAAIDVENKLSEYKVQVLREITNELNEKFEANSKAFVANTISQVVALSNDIDAFKKHIYEVSHDQIIEIAVLIAEKILHSKIEVDSACLSPMILSEIQKCEHLKVQSIGLSNQAQSLIDDLELQLKEQGIALTLYDASCDYVVLSGEVGQYDISVPTQLENIKRVITL